MAEDFRNRLSTILLLLVHVAVTTCRPDYHTDLSGGGPCPGQPEKGPCSNIEFKWAYVPEQGGCTMFTWGGCAGNEKNRFDTEQQCKDSCAGKNYTSSLYRRGTTAAPIPKEARGAELTFQETGKHKTFMFAQSNTFIQIDGDIIKTFQLRLCRQISFQFRTRLPHGLLVYHNVQVPQGIELNLEPYALYVIVQQGQLKVVHVYGKHSTALIVGRGLNRDEWHSVTVKIDVHGAKLSATVDNLREETDLKGLHKDNNYGVSVDLTSVVLIGGLSSEEKLHGVKYIIESFVGCIRDVVLSSGKSASDLLQIAPLIATKHENVQEGCTDNCATNQNLCFVGSRCINHYYTLTCDCFGTHYEGEHCDVYTATVLTLRGSSYVSYRVYDWKDRVHSARNRISMIFRTRFDDSALFYASGGDQGINHYIAAGIKNNSVHLEMDFGDGLLTANLGRNVATHQWNNLTISHDGNRVFLSLNNEMLALNISGNHHLYIDPEIYIGGGPELKKKKGMVSHNNFAGCLKYVFYNDISIIYELRKMNPKVHYIGVLRPEFYEEDVQVIPITYPFASSHIWWPNIRMNSLSLKLDFKSSRSMAVLASSDVTTDSGPGYWEVRVVNEEIRFELIPDTKTNNVTQLISVKHSPIGTWHTVEVNYAAGELKLTVDRRTQQIQPLHGLKFTLGDKVIVGSGFKINAGLVGCMRNVVVNGDYLEPRMVLQSERVVGEVALDDCQFVDPCHRPNTCEHGGKCSVKEDRLTCDCKGTGYIGKNCHFAEFRKTCEELALLGYTKPDVYLIDIDGNGRFPPAHVRCEFQSEEDSTKTIVEHNLPSQVDIRSASKKDFSFSIKYREFSAEMLQELVSHSLNCSQFIKYDCFKAPLELHSATWFISSANHTVDYLGDVKRGTCPCAIGRKCENPSQWCNCDVSEDKWNSDEGYYVHANSLGITEMVFLQQPGLPLDAQGRITLGPLECVETNTQRYVVTFTTSQSYIEVPGWRKGDLAFSFRTTGEKAILLYQPPIRPNYPSFMVALTDDFQLTFNFTLNTGVSKELVINSGRRLNGGEWHKLWIDYNKYHVRFMINTDYQMVDLKAEEEFGPFEGSMFIGGGPFDLLDKSSVHQGLIGCFRGLVVNEEILDIYSYMSVHLSEIIKDCKPSCDPNPCKNGAMCRELWSTFQCVCRNQWAHIGQYCETNINEKALTFITPESYLKKSYLLNATGDEKLTLKSMLHDRVLLNLRTYESTALVLYANDHINNFVHIHIYNGSQVVYMFNHGDEIHNITIEYPGLSSGQSVQLTIIKNIDSTTMYVNEKNRTIPVGVLLMEEYSNKPWKNPEYEVLAPQRPPAPPTDYFQVNLGGYDPDNLLLNHQNKSLPGYVGCIRGLQIGDTVIDLPAKSQENDNHNMTGVLPYCKMKCDAMPCKHQGICIEDFRKQEHTCNCEHTSYYGEFCSEEKGADFSGESVLQRQFALNGSVDHIKVQLAFSSNDLRQKYTVLLLMQIEDTRDYYLVVALTPEGHLTVQEDREGAIFGATVSDRNFLNGARHSVYYRRDKDEAELMIDRQIIQIIQIPEQGLINLPEIGTNEVQIGGANTTDPRFAIYKGYNGCLSNIFLEVNEYTMKPLEEYFFFTKKPAEQVHVTKPQGVRSAQCADHFDIIHRTSGPTLNISQIAINHYNHISQVYNAENVRASQFLSKTISRSGIDKTWVVDPPERVPYKSLYSEASTEEENTGRVVVITLSVLFVVVIIGCAYEVYRSDKQYRRRKEMETDASILRSKEQAEKMHLSFKQIRMDEEVKPVQNGKSKPSNGATQNGANVQFVQLNDIAPPPTEKVKTPILSERRISFRDSASELEWEPVGENSDLLTTMHEEDEEDEEDTNDNDTRPETNGLSKLIHSIPEEECEISASDDELTVPLLFTNKPLSPIFLNEQKRTFGNPISYLGGPRLAEKPRTSIESVLSLD